MKYFGTDGIRDKSDHFTPDFLARIIRGLIDYAGDEIKVLLAGDTRESTEWILQDLATACETFGIEYSTAGILSTPGINYCFYEMGYDFAIDVTASHNPYTDNGIKIFERGPRQGQKLNEKACQIIENSLTSNLTYTPVSPTIRENLQNEALALYLSHLRTYLGEVSFTDLHIGIDCANGATSVIGSQIFDQLGAQTTLINCCKDYNTKINQDCGSTHLEPLQTLVKDQHLDFGIAFDGDGDRCLMVDHQGQVIDGDQIIAILANYLHLDHLAITVMANQGLLSWTESQNIKTEITAVGDSNVAAAMSANHIQLGGEQSGHIILPGEPTGDGMLTALMVTKVIADTHTPLADLASIITKFPQVTVNLSATATQKSLLKTSDSIKKLLLDYNQKLTPCAGRLLVRPSGTEPLIRITMWGDDEPTIIQLAENLKSNLIKHLT